jgi:hypothetical protein
MQTDYCKLFLHSNRTLSIAHLDEPEGQSHGLLKLMIAIYFLLPTGNCELHTCLIRNP